MKKTFYRQDNIGRAKYTVSSHNGVDTHKDGSPFFGINIFSNKKKLKQFIDSLIADGYVERGFQHEVDQLLTEKRISN